MRRTGGFPIAGYFEVPTHVERFKLGNLKFDRVHRSSPAKKEDFDDDDNWVSRTQGLMSPHIGNGAGGPMY